jgi:hypothetical protein
VAEKTGVELSILNGKVGEGSWFSAFSGMDPQGHFLWGGEMSLFVSKFLQ